MYPAIFLDRDGVIIENRANYVRSWTDVAIYGQALTGLAAIKHLPYKIILVTNQSVIGRGIITLAEAKMVNQQLLAVVRNCGGRIDNVFMCPHAPDDNCDCRKPEPGLFLQAGHRYQLDFSRSIMVGDAVTDLLAGQAAGVSSNILVETGRGHSQIEQFVRPGNHRLKSFMICKSLNEVCEKLLSGHLSTSDN